MTNSEIRNLELDLIKKEENILFSSDNPRAQIREIGTEEVRYYDSYLGKIETYKFFDNSNGDSKEVIATNDTNINKERRDFYKQRVVPIRAFSKEKANKLLKIADELSRES
ncbi:MAG TPA: hypothetical protein VJ912_02825 [Candidatus Nanoarchaeia archaeon]|nr:hypothetical protein [Candidatus Nanoarchaeia archaeon]